MIELRSLGAAEIQTGTATLTPSQEVVFAAALYLILESGRPLSRSRLARLLWPGVPESTRSHRMRQTLLQLKKLGMLIDADRDNVGLSPGDVRRDIDLLSHDDGVKTDSHACLEFLPGYSPRLSESFRDWVDEKRSQAHAVATRALLSQLEQSRIQGDWAAVERIAGKCLSLDSYNETAVLAQAEAAAMRGGKKKAVSILDRYIEDLGSAQPDLKLPASLLRRRVVERVPDRPALLNADPPFVGREAEMAALTQKFAEARAGRGSATLILGEAGIGKSRLSAELGRFAELQGAQLLRVGCRRTDVTRPLSLFVDMVPELREMPGALGCGSETFVWLKRLTEFEQRPDSSRESDSSVLFHNVRSALFDLLDSVADERCLVILLEDMQWVDEASARILMGMVEWCASRRLLFVLNSRPDANSFLEDAAKARVNTIALGPLRAEASKALLQSMALRPSDEPQPDFVSWCLSVAEGNPFFLQELAHQWIETGQRHEAPPSVSNVLHERLSRLSSAALQVFQSCTLLGDYSTATRVEAMLKYPPHRVLSAIEELSNTAMLAVPAGDFAGGAFQPRHDFLASAALSRLSPISLAFLHRRAAKILETEFLDRRMPANLLWACAEHRAKAGDRESAFSLGKACAEHLLEVGLPAQASEGFERCIEYANSDAQKLTLLPKLALAYELAGEWGKCKNTLITAIQLSQRSDAGGTHNDYELLLVKASFRSGVDYLGLLSQVLECVASQKASPSHRVEAAIIAMKLAADFGEMTKFVWAYNCVLPLLSDQGVADRSKRELAIVYRTTCDHEIVSIEDLERFADAARATDGEQGYSLALMTAGVACRLTARYEEGLEFSSLALRHAKEHALHSRCCDIRLALIQLHLTAGKTDEASDVLKELREDVARSDNAKYLNEVNFNEARLALEVNDYPAAVTAFRRVNQDSFAQYSIARQGFSLAVQLRLALYEGAIPSRIAEILTNLEQAHLRIRGLGMQDFESHALYLGLCALGEQQRANNLIASYARVRMAKWPVPVWMARILEVVPVEMYT